MVEVINAGKSMVEVITTGKKAPVRHGEGESAEAQVAGDPLGGALLMKPSRSKGKEGHIHCRQPRRAGLHVQHSMTSK